MRIGRYLACRKGKVVSSRVGVVIDMKPEDAWKIERSGGAGALRWNGFVDGYNATLNKFIERDQVADVEELPLRFFTDCRELAPALGSAT